MKKYSILLILSILFANIALSQSTISPDGLVFPNKSLISTTDVVTVPSPAIGQSVYNSNAGITGAGASGVGFYSWNGTLWTNGASPVPAGGIVLSNIHPNSALLSAGFSLLGSYVVPNFSTYNAACNVFSPTNFPPRASYGNFIPSDFRILPNGTKFYHTNTYFNSVNSNGLDIFDMTTETWLTRTSTTYGINVTGGILGKASTFSVISGSLYAWGGQVYNSGTSTSTPNDKLWKLIDEANNTWVETAFTLPVGVASRELSSSIANSGKMIVFGGVQANIVKNDGFIIDPVTGTSTALTPPVSFTARTLPKLYIINNKLIIFGGYRSFSYGGGYHLGVGGELCDGIMYDFATLTWTNISATNAPSFDNANTRASYAGASFIFEKFNSLLYYVGFNGNSTTYTIERKVFDPNTNTWINFLGPAPTLTYRLEFNGKIANGHLIMYGGSSAGGAKNDGAIWDIATGAWSNFSLNSSFANQGFQMEFLPTSNSFFLSGARNSLGYGTTCTKLPDPCFSTPTPTTFYMYNK